MTDPASILWRAQMAIEFDDTDDLQQALDAIDTVLAQRPTSLGHHVRGRILGLMQRFTQAAEAHAAAIAANPQNAQALYSLALLYGKSGNATDALRCFEAAALADPKHHDAWYNAGQAAYNLTQYDKALAAWSHLARINPSSFNALKKVIQAHRALHQHAAAALLTDQLRALQSSSEEAAIRDLYEVVVDQFSIDTHQVLVYESLRPRDPAMHNQWVFAIQDRPVAVQLESSAYGRDKGVPYVLALNDDGRHATIGPLFHELPAYDNVKKLAIQALTGALEAR